MVCLIAMTAFKTEVKAQNTERIQASYLLSFGRLANSGELGYWNGQGQRSVQQLVDNHKAYIKSNIGSIGKEVIIKSYIDALGYRPSQGEIDYHSKFGRTYTEMMNSHMVYINTNASEYEKVIKRSYQAVLGRQANSGEIAYWRGQGVFSYMILVSCHQDWKNRNPSAVAPTSTATTQSNSSGTVSASSSVLATATVSATVLAEVKGVYSGMVAAGGGNMVAAGGGNMVAAGGGNMVAAGGGNMVAAGGGNMVAAGGGN